MTVCIRCHQEPRLPGQRWGRACFAEYRREQRASKREARAEEPGSRAERPAEPVQSAKPKQEQIVASIPSFTVKIRPYGLVLRFLDGQLHSADSRILAKLRSGTFYEAWLWIGQQRC